MLKTSHGLFILVSLVMLSACGKKASKQINDSMKESLTCLTVGIFNGMANSVARDYDVKLYRTTIDRVLNEIKTVKKFKSVDFWDHLSFSTKEQLNHELNLILNKTPVQNQDAVYKSVAIFFKEALVNGFYEDTEYRIKDSSNTIYSFSSRGGRPISRREEIGMGCGTNEGIDLSKIRMPKGFYRADEIKEIYECKTDDKSFTLMEIRDVVFVNVAKKIYKTSIFALKKEDLPNRLVLKMDTTQVVLRVAMRKKKSESIEDYSGRKSKIKFQTADVSIDDTGACNTLKHSI